jgi:NitT/TauT family transport system substrate-binding protein
MKRKKVHPMMKRTLPALAAAGILAVSLAACSAGGSSTAGSSGSTVVPTVKMMVGGIDKQIYLPYQLAQSLGFYKKYGVNMELSTESNGGVGAEDAMASGSVDLAGAWYVHTVDFQTKGKDVINLVQLSGAPGEREMCTAKSGVKSAADFKGKNLGVTDLGSGTDELTQFIASKQGISRSQYQTVAVHAGTTAIAALQRGTADCVMTTQPTVGAISSLKLATTSVDLATAAGATKALGGDWPAAGLLARADWVKANPDAAQKVVDALVATITKAQYIAGLTTDKGQFLPDGIMPAGGPKTIFAMEKALGVDTSKITIAGTFTNKYAYAANKLEGFTTTTPAAGANG